MSSALSGPPSNSGYGYTCKIWMAAELERRYLGGKYYVWFARDLNPIGDGSRPANGESSNPLNIYFTLDTAIKRKDINHSKIKDLRAGMLRVIGTSVASSDWGLAQTLRREIHNAALEMFHPQLWRLDLAKIDPHRIKTDLSQPGWDEQYVADLVDGEFEVIVE